MIADPELSKAVNELAVTAVSVITSTILPLLVYFLVQWLRAKISKVKNEEVRDALNDALSRLDLTAETVVKELNQTLVDGLKKSGGKLTKDQQGKILKVAYDRLSSRLPIDAAAILQRTFGDRLREVLVGKLEKKVGDNKLISCD
jgi:hypothetical protein